MKAKLRGLAVLGLVSLITIGCASETYWVGSAGFPTKEKALAFQSNHYDKDLRGIQPLEAPIAESVLVITPTREIAEKLARSDVPNASAELLSFMIEFGVTGRDFWARAIKARNLFRTVTLKHADNLDGVEIPAKGYLLWLEIPNTTNSYWHVAAKGEGGTSELVIPDRSGASSLEQVEVFLGTLQEYVVSHPAQP